MASRGMFNHDRFKRAHTDRYQTPPRIFVNLDLYHFTLDAAADRHNHLTKEQNTQLQPWYDRVFCNPPYSMVAAFVRKVFLQKSRRRLGGDIAPVTEQFAVPVTISADHKITDHTLNCGDHLGWALLARRPANRPPSIPVLAETRPLPCP
jgi:DNA N-6-adenine-methyltransferase (Dam)